MSQDARLEMFGTYVLNQAGRPYVWCGKGLLLWTPAGPVVSPFAPTPVFDCAGLITCGLYFANYKDIRFKANAHVLYSTLVPTDEPGPWDFACYGSKVGNKASHIEVMTANHRLFGAIGGDHNTLKPTVGAMVKYRLKERTDLLGWRINPLKGATP